MNYLITGGCGFIGTNLIRRLFKDKDNYVRVIDNLSTSSLENFLEACKPSNKNRLEFINCDIRDKSLAMKVCKDIDVIVHLAANTGVPASVKSPRIDCFSNVIGTLNYLEGARHSKVKRFIFASTGSVLGIQEPPYHEELFGRPVSPYGASKGAAESYCHVYNAIYGVETVSLRFSNIYGPFSDNKKVQLISHFIRGAIDGVPLTIFGDGSQTRDFCFVDDLVDAIELSILTPDIGGNVFQIATNIETSVQSVTDIIVDIFDRKYSINDIGIKYSDERPGDVNRNFSDVTKARELLQWKSKVNIDEGIDKTINWFMEKYFKWGK